MLIAAYNDNGRHSIWYSLITNSQWRSDLSFGQSRRAMSPVMKPETQANWLTEHHTPLALVQSIARRSQDERQTCAARIPKAKHHVILIDCTCLGGSCSAASASRFLYLRTIFHVANPHESPRTVASSTGSYCSSSGEKYIPAKKGLARSLIALGQSSPFFLPYGQPEHPGAPPCLKPRV